MKKIGFKNAPEWMTSSPHSLVLYKKGPSSIGFEILLDLLPNPPSQPFAGSGVFSCHSVAKPGFRLPSWPFEYITYLDHLHDFSMPMLPLDWAFRITLNVLKLVLAQLCPAQTWDQGPKNLTSQKSSEYWPISKGTVIPWEVRFLLANE